MAIRWLSTRRLAVATVLVVVAALVLITTSRTNSQQVETLPLPKAASALFEPEAIAATAPVAPPAAGCLEGVLTASASGGPLCDLVLQYASAAAVADTHGLRLALPASLMVALSSAFDTLSAERLDWVLQEPPCGLFNVTEQTFLAGEMLHPSSVDDMIRITRARRLPLVLTDGAILTEFIASSTELVRKEFHFRSSIQQTAKKKLDSIKIDTAKKTKQKKSGVCTVGVDVQRKEDAHRLLSEYGLKQEAGAAFYKAATEAMLRGLKPQCRAVAFLITSDDQDWSRKQLLPALNRKAMSKTPPSLGFLMSSESAEDDLCLLASCQHTIMSYGNFGLTAAILAGGKTIMYDTAKNGASKLPVAQQFAAKVSDWQLIA